MYVKVSLNWPESLSHFCHCAGSAVLGQNTTFLPHKGVLSPAEKALYVSYSDGAGKLSIIFGYTLNHY
jgi:hypothetical protein